MAVEEFGRISYIEPTNAENINGAKSEGTFSDSILFPYEDYNMAVDLSIRVANRYSCGFWEDTGEMKEFNYSTQNGTISLFGGTDGYLTTNYTDISMTNPSENTQEVLGIESINITYNSWLYPEVDIKFVDVRGATVMQPAEQNYYRGEQYAANSKLYQALFTYPYPIFTLKVKGFYGKGVTYKLAVENTKFELDSESGNFIINVKFVGYMFGIYADLPMQFLAVAPYTATGSRYWTSQIQNGKFTFNNGASMLTFPELRKKLVDLLGQQEYNNIAAKGEIIGKDFDEQIKYISNLKDTYPFKNWTNIYINDGQRGKYAFNIFPSDVGEETINNDITNFITALSGYDYTYGTHYCNGFSNFKEIVDKNNETEKEKNKEGFINAKFSFIKGKDGYEINFKSDEALYNEIKNAVLENISKYDKDIMYVYIISSTKGGYAYGDSFIKELDELIKSIKDKQDENTREYKQLQELYIERGLGFKPSVKNFYDLIFAHMDTFLTSFYEHNNTIKTQLAAKNTIRKKSEHNITDGYTDTEREFINDKPSGISRAAFLPPYTAFYEDTRENGANKKQLRWPGDVSGGENFEEVIFVKELLAATEMYADISVEIDKIEQKLKGDENGKNLNGNSYSSALGGSPSTDVSKFIPLTTYDFINKDIVQNPYLKIKNKINNGTEDIEGAILGLFALRAFYYLCSNNDKAAEAQSFGILEAINFFKAVGDNASSNFLSFIKKYADSQGERKDKKNFIDIITSTNGDNESKCWDFGDALNANKALFIDGEKFTYSLYKNPKEGENYNFFPIWADNFEDIKKDFGEGAESLKKNVNYISFSNYENLYEGDSSPFIIGQPLRGGTFVLYETNNYADAIRENVENQIKESQEYLKKNDSGYGNRGGNEYGNVENLKKVFRNYGDNLSIDIASDLYKNKTITDINGYTRNPSISNIINPNVKLDDYYIKIPSFNMDWVEEKNIESKAEKFLSSLPFYNNKFNVSQKNGYALKSKLLREGSIYWKEDTMGVPSIVTGATLSRRNYLKNYFINWANDDCFGFASIASLMGDKKFYKEGSYAEGMTTIQVNEFNLEIFNENNKDVPAQRQARNIQDFLRNLFFTVCTIFDYYSGLKESNFSVKKDSMENAFDGFMKELAAIYGTEVKDLNKTSEFEVKEKVAVAKAGSAFENKDVRLALYMSLKSLYDKWLCNPHNGNKTWKLRDGDSDFENFIYADSFYHDIGQALNVNATKISSWLSNVLPTANSETTEGEMHYNGRSVYQFISEVAQDCGAVLYAMPQKFGIEKKNDVGNMFRPISINSNWDSDNSAFVFMYSYKPSEHLGDSSDMDMNGWAPEGDGVDLTNEEIRGKFIDSGYSIPAFGVTFAKQNQSIFKNITLNTDSAGVTDVSIATTMNIASKSSESPRQTTIFGQDLYRVYSQYSYKCGVETMGNMQIMPLMYFQLNNVPMWKGAYMIQKVSHSITAGDIRTSFEGVRLNKYAIPMADGTLLTTRDGGNYGGDDGSTGTVYGANYGGNDRSTGTVYGANYGGNDGSMGTVYGCNNVINVTGNQNYLIPQKYTIDFNESNITPQKPLICVTPAHGPNTGKKREWEWSTKVVDRIVEILKDYKFKDGTSYANNIQRCNKDGMNTSTGYSMQETKDFIKKLGSNKVISVVPHWNGAAGRYHGVFVNKASKCVRDDSMRFAECMADSAKKTATILYYTDYTLPEDSKKRKAIDPNDCRIVNLFEGNSDEAPQLDCACILTENWFADFPYGCRWDNENEYWKKTDGIFDTFRGWLMDKGIENIAQMHAEGIKRYIDSLS